MLVNNKRLNILNIGGEVILQPGVNDLPNHNAQTWQSLLDKYPKLASLVEDGLIVVVEDPGGSEDDDQGGGEPMPAPSPQPFRKAATASAGNDLLSRYREKDAIRLIKETADDQLLNSWYEVEQRPPVIRAIEDQFAALARAGEPK